MKRRLFLPVILVLITLLGYFWLRPNHTATPGANGSADTKNSSATEQNDTKPSGFDKTQYSLTNPSSVWVIVNKKHPLQPISYVSSDLVLPGVSQRVPGTSEMKMRAPAAAALKQMFVAADKANIRLLISTAYRSYSYQKVLYNGYVASEGQTQADTQSARPGYSEHQTGLAVDIRAKSGKCPIEQCFGNLPEGKWLAANAYKYGFLLRYPKDKESVTGYEYEPWHFRYVGTTLSQELHKQGVETLEEFFDVSGGKTYN